ncbi:MAG: UDP-N-acetylmuramate--L-alanine ligase [Ilumatobacter sp.]|uniref:UDP-N-acetylmuramate--L-alanine ligase n=1 Tax=Ilumatobacter sp. TaxID=1967498 RepID=UPI0026135CBB|nr:UDP-N-acetylmuramate--L-alanine ligase [Ilumatobacter sp.]MDJ0770210.1 UDP-N-acetylmuramate--L-alanine ligase [Ilumatobacter sp.]
MTTPPSATAHPPAPPLDLSRPQRLHVIGAAGPGMSAIALALAQMGHNVSGVDLRERQVLDRLRAAGVIVHIGHHRSHVVGCDAVTASTAIAPDLNELDEARKLGIATLPRAGMLASICAQAKSLAVAGTHGKTTTTSMLMLMLAEAELRPSFVIGGDVRDMGTGAQWTGGEWFVVEADESDGTHLQLPLHGTILTNIDVDHLDHYGSIDEIERSFDRYLAQIPGPKVVCADNRRAAEVAVRHDCVTYGMSEQADVRAVDVVADHGSHRFAVERNGVRLATIELPLRGEHNVVNATGAFAMAIEIGIDPHVAAGALAKFGGVARRFDVRGQHGGATFVDDYAHLPTEIDAVLRAARDSGDGWRRVVAVFQPNRYNRMAEMWRDYANAFEAADLVVITDIYPSGTQPIPGVTGKLVVNAVLDEHPQAHVVWLPRRDELIDYLAGRVVDGDVCVSMGCGDIASLPDEILAARRGALA